MVRIEDVCEVNPRDPGPGDQSMEISFVPMPAVSDTEGIILKHDTKRFSEVAKGYTRFREQDVIFAKITPCMENGKSAVATALHGGFACGSTEFHVLRSRGEIMPAYLWRFLRQEAFRQEAERHMAGAVGQRRVPAQYMKNAQIPLPPIDVQRSIVSKLDGYFNRIKRVRSELAHVPRLVKRYKQSIWSSAFTGKVSSAWRAKNGQQLAWRTMLASEACEVVQSGSTPSKECFRAEPGIPYLKVYNIVDQQVAFEYRAQFIDEATHQGQARSIARPGDVLMNIVGPPLGKVAIVPDTYPQWNINQAIVLFRPKALLRAKFLYHLLCSGIPYEPILNETRGSAGQTNISLSQCRNMELVIPSIEEQDVIVERLEEMFDSCTNVEAHQERVGTLVERLEGAISAKAFSGQL